MFLNSKEGQNYYQGVLPVKSKKKETMSLTRGSRTTKGNTTSYPAISGAKRSTAQDNNSSSRSNSREASKDNVPEDVMVILVQNHIKRDESMKRRKENASKLIKEKQAKA